MPTDLTPHTALVAVTLGALFCFGWNAMATLLAAARARDASILDWIIIIVIVIIIIIIVFGLV